MKYCYACQNTLTPGEFRRNRTTADGLRSECKACHNKQKRDRKAALRDAVNLYKDSRGCADCGTRTNLDLDHLPQFAKTSKVSTLVSNGSARAIESELTKCEVVCKGCHQKRTKARKV